MSDDNITDIEDARKQRGRPRNKPLTKGDFMHPVGITFIADVMGMDKGTVRRDLEGLDPVNTDGDPRYKFSEAVKRVILARNQKSAGPSSGVPTLEQIASLTPDKFPKNAHTEFWSGMKHRRQFFEESNQLWSTEKVQEAFDEIVEVFRTAIMTISDRVLTAQRDGSDLADVQKDILKLVNAEAAKISETMEFRSAAGDYALWEDDLMSGANQAGD